MNLETLAAAEMRAALLEAEHAKDTLRDVERLLEALALCGGKLEPNALDPVAEALATRRQSIEDALGRIRAAVPAR